MQLTTDHDSAVEPGAIHMARDALITALVERRLTESMRNTRHQHWMTVVLRDGFQGFRSMSNEDLVLAAADAGVSKPEEVALLCRTGNRTRGPQ